MKMSDEYANDPKVVATTQQLTEAINNKDYFQPMVDLHSINELTGERVIWLQIVDKNGNSKFVFLNQDFMDALSKNMMIANSKNTLNGMG